MLSDHRRGRDTRCREAASHENERRCRLLSKVSWVVPDMTTFSTRIEQGLSRSMWRNLNHQLAH